MSKRTAHFVNDRERTADIAVTEDVDFKSLLLSERVLKGLKKAGFVKPSPIQLDAIPKGKCGFDLILQAKSGTGKTCVFAVIALEMVSTDVHAVQILAIAPTREIAVQITEVLKSIGCAIKGLKVHSFIGGLPVKDDKVKLQDCHIAVGSPGRIKQLIAQKMLRTNNIRLFVLDEADKLLDESNKQDINFIYQTLPVGKQMLTMSATYPESLAELIACYMMSPLNVNLGYTTQTLLGIKQFARIVKHHPMFEMQMQYKIKDLLQLLSTVPFSQALVFCNSQLWAQRLCDTLIRYAWPACYLTGAQEQPVRLKALQSLQNFQCRVLLSTDLSSRGIDAENVNLVINMDVPRSSSTYLHRIGRAGRFGSFGLAITLCSVGSELERLQANIYELNLNIKILSTDLSTVENLWQIDFERLPRLEGKKRVEVEKETEKESVNADTNCDDEGNVEVLSTKLKGMLTINGDRDSTKLPTVAADPSVNGSATVEVATFSKILKVPKMEQELSASYEDLLDDLQDFDENCPKPSTPYTKVQFTPKAAKIILEFEKMEIEESLRTKTELVKEHGVEKSIEELKNGTANDLKLTDSEIRSETEVMDKLTTDRKLSSDENLTDSISSSAFTTSTESSESESEDVKPKHRQNGRKSSSSDTDSEDEKPTNQHSKSKKTVPKPFQHGYYWPRQENEKPMYQPNPYQQYIPYHPYPYHGYGQMYPYSQSYWPSPEYCYNPSQQNYEDMYRKYQKLQQIQQMKQFMQYRQYCSEMAKYWVKQKSSQESSHRCKK